MSLFSDERVEELADKMLKELKHRGLVKNEIQPTPFRSAVKRAYVKFYRLNEEVEGAVKRRLMTMAKGKGEGSVAQKVLFEKLFLEEWKKR